MVDRDPVEKHVQVKLCHFPKDRGKNSVNNWSVPTPHTYFKNMGQFCPWKSLPPYKKWWNSFQKMINPYLKNGETRYHQPIKKRKQKIGAESSISRRCLGRLFQSSDSISGISSNQSWTWTQTPSAFIGTSQASWWLWRGWFTTTTDVEDSFLATLSELQSQKIFITSPLWITFHIWINLKTHCI